MRLYLANRRYPCRESRFGHLRWVAAAVMIVALFVTTASPGAAAPPISGNHPWIVALCKFSDLNTEPATYTPAYFQQIFATDTANNLDFRNWWSTVSYGNLTVNGTRVTSTWHPLGMTRYEWAGLNRYDKIRACGNAAANDPAINNDYSQFYGIIAIFNDDTPARAASSTLSGAIGTGDTTINVADASVFPTPPFAVGIDDGSGNNGEEVHVTGRSGNALTISRAYEGSTAKTHNAGATVSLYDGGDLGAASLGQVGITLNSKNYNLGVVVLPPETNLGSIQHETGHGFGYDHSRALSTSTTDYQDCYDIMSFDACRNYGVSLYNFQGDFGAAGVLNDPLPAAVGPGLDAIDLDIQNWMPSGRTFNFSNGTCTQTTRNVAALNYPGASGDMEIRIPASLTIPTPNGGTTTSDYYTVELRDKSGYDRGIPQNSVLLHLHGLDGRSYWVDQFGGSYVGHQGAMYLGDEFVDTGSNVTVTVNRMDTAAHTATVAMANGGANCKIGTSLHYTGPTSADYNDPVTLSGVLTVSGTSVPVPNASVQFNIGTDQCTGTTDANGNASCTLTIQQDPPGAGNVTASYGGDSAYDVSADSLGFTVNREDTSLAYTGPSSADYNDPLGAAATLTDRDDGTPIQGKTVTLTLGTQSCTGVTDAGGHASCSFVITQDPPGPGTVSATFAGDTDFAPSGDSHAFTVNREETQLTYTGLLTVHYHDPVTVSAQLTDPDGGAPIDGRSITFTLGGTDTCAAATDSLGNASCSLTPHVTGMQSLVASFAGDIDYVPASDTHTFSVTPEETTMTYTGPTVILAGASGATLTARLVEDGANDGDGDGGAVGPDPSETVTLSVGSQSCTGVTDSSGNVGCTIPSVSVPLGPETVKATFGGDAYYQAASASTTAIVFAFPSSGDFVLGDTSVASAAPSSVLTWWDHSWSSVNALSGGSAPSAFKGFASNITTLPTTSPANVCGSTFTVPTGNSSSPPRTVPSYMGVLVASSVTQSGSTIHGTWGKIVVVKTNPGYGPNPGTSGTGPVVATFCH